MYYSENYDLIGGLLVHGQLNGERLFDAMNFFRLLINRKTGYNLQDFRHLAEPKQFQRRYNEQIYENSQYDVQILLGPNKNHFCIAYYPLYVGTDEFIIKAFKPTNEYADPDKNQKAIVRQMYGNKALTKWKFFRSSGVCPDDGIMCDCKEIFTLAYAILLAQGRDPGSFRFRMSNDENLPATFYIRKKLYDMFMLDRLIIFDEDI